MTEQKTKKYDYPEAIVGALIINEEEKILLGESVKWKGKWTVFGGHVDLGAKMADAVIREVKEETDLDVEIEAQLDFSESIFSKDFHDERHFIFMDYVCKYDGNGEVKINKEFKNECKWVSIEEAKKMDLAVGTKQIIEKYLKYKEQKNLLNSWKRCQADFENFKKRQSEQQIEMIKYANQNLILDILPVIDNFHASTDHIPEDQKDNPWVTGIMYIQKQLEKVLSDNNVEEIETKVGDKFNPEMHEAISDAKQRKESESTNKIVKIVLKGYKLNGKIIRAVRVIVE